MLAFRCLSDERLKYYATFSNRKAQLAQLVLAERRAAAESAVPPPSEDTALGRLDLAASPSGGASVATTPGELLLDIRSLGAASSSACITSGLLLVLRFVSLLLRLLKYGSESSFCAIRIACSLAHLVSSSLIVRLLPPPPETTKPR